MSYEIKIVRVDGFEFTAFVWNQEPEHGVRRACTWARGRGIDYRSVYALPCISKAQTVPSRNL